MMADREKVIKGLEQHENGSMFDRCGDCPYYELADEPFLCRDKLISDALALWKEQEDITNWLMNRFYAEMEGDGQSKRSILCRRIFYKADNDKNL